MSESGSCSELIKGVFFGALIGGIIAFILPIFVCGWIGVGVGWTVFRIVNADTMYGFIGVGAFIGILFGAPIWVIYFLCTPITVPIGIFIGGCVGPFTPVAETSWDDLKTMIEPVLDCLQQNDQDA